MGVLPLNKRFRRMNLFDVGRCIIEGVEYVEEVLESNICITKEYEKDLYVPLLLPRLRTDEFTEEDYRNNVTIVCLTSLSLSSLDGFLLRFFRGFTLKKTDTGAEVEFIERQDATECLYLSNSDFTFLRPIGYIELPRAPEARNKGSKYCRDVPCTRDKILLGPLNIDSNLLRDALDEISPLQSFRVCRNPLYFVFTFRNSEFCEPFVKATSHIFISDAGRSLVSIRAYKGCSILNLGKNIPHLVPRRMTGPIALSKERTRIVTVLNVLGPWDLDVSKIVEEIKSRCSKYKGVKDVMVPRDSLRSGRQPGSSRVFIECKDLETSEKVYDELGGLIYKDRIVATGYYPELNYAAGEYE
ncbi:U2 snRNP auxiliary splicing factor U2AF large subunit [Encephalitozoon romaleae SJ-2008]|uniref:U2 snRNP auxiliary splicing factor U2AF large subunit n=1 Tax=Encephalitozoon romaleae (strain SJ-2008) TaxID=1178016 RepID=I7AEC4_ENCRO|nr:U2 snRNP auxiliary splicing factor U2AF large subunit [Encephalitozoon romaleae SJ-2008]AFN83005.1 U2 snRNP auxiliary splicing factor U2AF large subunit [Encephalitozoon romaleae SJ-2008]